MLEGKTRASLDSVVVPLAPLAWAATRRYRSYTYHGVRPCPQSEAPYGSRSAEQTRCADCNEFFDELLMGLARWIDKRSLRSSVAQQQAMLGRRIQRFIKHESIDATRRLSTEHRLHSNLGLLYEASWFTSALPDIDDQMLAVRFLRFARSNDEVFGTDLPYERLGSRLGLVEAECARAWGRIESVLRAARPRWVENNFDHQMSRRWASGLVSDCETLPDVSWVDSGMSESAE